MIIQVGSGFVVDASRWESTVRLNGGGQFSFSLPATSPGAALVAALAQVTCRWRGATVAAGIISSWSIADGKMQVRGEGMERELATVMVTGAIVSGGAGISLKLAVDWIGTKLPGGWSLTNNVDVSNAAKVYLEAIDDSLLAVLGTVCELGGCWYVISGKTLTVSDALGTVRHNVTLLGLDKTVDAADIVNKIYLRGAGDGEAALDLGPSTDSAPGGYSKDVSASTVTWSSSPYALRERAVTLGWIGPQAATNTAVAAAANLLLQAGVKWLQRYATPVESYRAQVAHPAVIAPLERVALHWRGPGLLVNAEPAVVEARLEIAPDRLLTTSLTLETDARRLPTDAEVIAQTMLDANRRRTWPQLVLESNTLEGEGLVTEAVTSLDLVMTWPSTVVQVRSVVLDLSMVQTDATLQLPASLEYRFGGTGSWVAYSAPVDITSAVVNATTRRPSGSTFTLNVRGVAPTEAVKVIGASISGGINPSSGNVMRALYPLQLVSADSNQTNWVAGTNKIADVPAGSLLVVTGSSTTVTPFDTGMTGMFYPVTLGALGGRILVHKYNSSSQVIQPYPLPIVGTVGSGRVLSTAYYSAKIRARIAVRSSALAQ